MALLSEVSADPTLLASDAALEEEEARQLARPYLGMSAIGNTCERQLWYGFRWAMKVRFKARTLKLFADGHLSEDVMAERLRKVPGLQLITIDPETGGQIGHRDLDDHFRGHADGHVLGLIQAPKTWHVWEAKSTNEKSFNALKRIIAKVGEKNALREWKPVYYAQACLYMKYSGYHRHYTTVSTPGVRDWVSIRTDFNEVEAQRQIAKARRIIDSNVPPSKVSTAPSAIPCKWCDFASICHHGEWASNNCRTCLHSTPVEGGDWHCDRWSNVIPIEAQREGCPAHKYIPDLVPGTVDSADELGVSYTLNDGTKWRNGEDV